MEDFPDFMRRSANRIPTEEQNTPDIDGYVYTAADGSQMAFWTCRADRTSAVHVHPFDEYMTVVAGRYTVLLDGVEHVLGPGDELFIPAGTPQGGSCTAGTRTIHAFGGRRVRDTG
ncbi:MAG: cupin domain-containing protein [Clostridia bacterium]|nr:cupin domain-containing protein [Clostridia bacterium]